MLGFTNCQSSPYFRFTFCLGEVAKVRINLDARTNPLLKEATMKLMKLAVKNFVSDESGQDLIEYALIASLVGLVAVTALGTLATAISGAFTGIAGKITG
jgi:pilus assembly protein Flp/PilA